MGCCSASLTNCILLVRSHCYTLQSIKTKWHFLIPLPAKVSCSVAGTAQHTWLDQPLAGRTHLMAVPCPPETVLTSRLPFRTRGGVPVRDSLHVTPTFTNVSIMAAHITCTAPSLPSYAAGRSLALCTLTVRRRQEKSPKTENEGATPFDGQSLPGVHTRAYRRVLTKIMLCCTGRAWETLCASSSLQDEARLPSPPSQTAQHLAANYNFRIMQM